MIPHENSFYIVYPSWAELSPSWAQLPLLFAAPLESGKLNHRSDWAALGYVSGHNCYEFIDGPCGNGIIKGMGSSNSRFLWKAVLNSQFSGSRPPGVPLPGVLPFIAPSYDVSLLEEKERAEHALGFEKKAKTYVPSISLEYEGGSDATVFVSLTFRKDKVDKEVCRSVSLWWSEFGVKCFAHDGEEGLPKTARLLVAADREHHWMVMQRTNEDVGLIFARTFYLACAAKKLAPRNLLAVHLIGNFEGKPEMATKWRGPDGKLKYGG
jgi:hypothetical protein